MRAFILPEEDAKPIAEHIVSFFSRLYPKYYFILSKKTYTPSEISNLYYTEIGVENESLFPNGIHSIMYEIEHRHYKTPMIVIQRGRKHIIIDGQKRALAAFILGIPWSAFVIKTNAKRLFIEKTIVGKVEDVVRQFFKSKFVN